MRMKATMQPVKTNWTGAQVRRRLRELGIPVVRLSGMTETYPSALYSWFNGGYMNPARVQRIVEAMDELAQRVAEQSKPR